ncbi:MAG: serine/threonine-protein kinase [Gemmatimonadaceae bacterium]
MPATQCPVCSGTLPETASFCPSCGTPTPSSTVRATGASAYAPPAAEHAAAERRRALQAAIGDSCEVRELIGRGGFAEVYAGWDVRLKREVAIKTLRGDVSSPSLLERFQREAEAVAKLRHPHIIPIYSVGESGGVAYFTMPRISGESLGAALEREKRLSISEACRILSEAAGALEEAHRAGVVHRDVKPENIMLEGRDRRALVMDFGIAKNAESGEHQLTGTGMVMGTPQYMSPEQAAGDRAIDHRTDQYSLAMIGYRMLAGRLPFESESVQTLLVQQVTQAPPPLRSLASDVPETVASTIERALSKNPNDRFPSLADFAAALSAAREISGAAVPARRHTVSLPDRIARMRALLPGWAHPLTLGTLVAAVALIVIAPRNTPPVVLEIAAQRDEALFAARSQLADRGVAGPFVTDVNVESRTATHRFLRETIGTDSIDELARAGVPIWLWHTRTRARSGGPAYHIDVAAGGRVSRFEESIHDTATAPTLPLAAAESLAVAELATRGWDVAALVRRRDSVVTRRNRTDHYLTWRRADLVIPFQATDTGVAADTGFSLLRVRVSGDRVTDYQEWVQPAASYRRESQPRVFDVIGGVASFLLSFGLLGGAIVFAIARQRHDSLQWRPALVLAVGMLALLGIASLPRAITQVQFSSVGGQLPNFIAMAVMACIMLLPLVVFTYVSAESLAAERGLSLMDGSADLTRGRLAPELASGAAMGGALGVVLASVEALGTQVSHRVHGASLGEDLPTVLRWGVPLPDLLLMLVVAVGVAVGLCFLQALIWRRAPSRLLVILLPPLLVATMIIGVDDLTIADKVVAFVMVAVISLANWRYGLVAAALAVFIGMGLSELITMAAATGASSAVMIYAAALAAPLILGRVAYTRFAATKR